MQYTNLIERMESELLENLSNLPFCVAPSFTDSRIGNGSSKSIHGEG